LRSGRGIIDRPVKMQIPSRGLAPKGDVIVTDTGYQLGSGVQQDRPKGLREVHRFQSPPGAAGTGRCFKKDRSRSDWLASEVWDDHTFAPGLGVAQDPQHRKIKCRDGAAWPHASKRCRPESTHSENASDLERVWRVSRRSGRE